MRFLMKSIMTAFLVGVVTALYFLCCTPQGLVINLRYIMTLFPGTLNIEKINGTLVSGFSLENIRYQTKDENITLKSLTLHWHPQQLLRGKFAIDSLILEQPKITLFSSNSTSSNVSLGDISFLKRIVIHTMMIHQLSIQKDNMRFDLSGELRNHWDFQWKLSIPTLKKLDADYAGAITGSGTMVGNRLTPILHATLQVNKLIISNQTMGELSGHANIAVQPTVKLSSFISTPILTGTMNITQGDVIFPALGIHLNDIAINAILNQSNKISFQGSLRSADGVGKAQGDIDLKDSRFPITLALQGNNMNILHIPKFKIAASPDIKLKFIYPNMEIQGKVAITKAKIKLKNYINTVSLPDETVFVGEPKLETPSILSASKLHLTVVLGGDVYFDYKDFVTHLGGQLVIDQSPNRLATATGEIDAIQGKYTIYGQNLVINTGRLIYTGNVLTNPGLNIEAIRTVKNINTDNNALIESQDIDATTTVGVRIIGTAQHPQVTLFSNPGGLSQAQILSALGGGGAALMSAISALNPGASKFDGMTSKLTKMLGLSEVNISSVQTFNTTTNQMQSTPAFVVGKKISKKLSLHYSVGIFNPVSIFNVRYQMNKHWAIQSETSTINNGADILYGFESSQ